MSSRSDSFQKRRLSCVTFAMLAMAMSPLSAFGQAVVYSDDFNDISSSPSGFYFDVLQDLGSVFSDGSMSNAIGGFVGSSGTGQLIISEEGSQGVTGVAPDGAIKQRIETFSTTDDTSGFLFFGLSYTDGVLPALSPGSISQAEISDLTVSFEYKTDLGGEYSARLEANIPGGDFANRLDLGVLTNTGGSFQSATFDLSSADPGQLANFVSSMNGSGNNQVSVVFGQSGDPNTYQHNSALTIDNLQIESPTAARLNTGTFGANPTMFTFGTLTSPGALDVSGSNIVIDASTIGAGGLGFDLPETDFDATQYQLEVEARLLSGNLADNFLVLLSDVDGDDSGAGLGSDDFVFSFGTGDFNDTTFATSVIPLGSGNEVGIVTTAGFTNGGDGLQDFDLTRFQIQADGASDLLAIEIASVSIVPLVQQLGDFNLDGLVDGADYAFWRNNLNGNESVLGGNGDGSGVVDSGDLAVWLAAFGGAPGVGSIASPAPEPATVCLVAMLCAGCSLTGRIRL